MLKREQELIQTKMQEQMEKAGLDVMILSNPDSVYYATGMSSMLLYTSNRIGMALAVVPKTGKVTLICSEFEAYAAKNICDNINIETYPVWIYVADIPDDGEEKSPQPDMNRTFKIAAEVINGITKKPEKVGVERGALPYDHMLFLQSVYGEERIEDCTNVLIESRVRKTPWEIQCLKKCAQATERAMHMTAQGTEPGMTEEDIMNLWNQSWVAQGKEFYSQFTANTLADQYSPVIIPRDLPHIKEGDLVRLDGGTICHGYASDIARTYAIGEKVAPEREEIFNLLLESSDKTFGIVGPGTSLNEVYNLAMDIIGNKIKGYKRGHFGHSIGCALFPEEYPFIAANETRVMEPGMVFCLEMPYYSSFNSSYNLEDTFAVTETGIERFTHINRSLFWK